MAGLNGALVFGFFSFAAGFVCLSMAIYLAPYWKKTNARLLLLLVIAVAVWSLTYGMELISPNLILKLWWVKFQYFGAAWIGMLLFCFVLGIAMRRRQMRPIEYIVLGLVPIAAILLVLTNSTHHLMWRLAWLDLTDSGIVTAYRRGAGFWGFISYSYLLILVSTIILIRSISRARGQARKQLLTMLVGILFPWLANIFYVSGFDTFRRLDFTPVAFTFTGIIFSWGLLRYQMLGLIPLAHEMIIESVHDPVVALDMNDRILELNKAAQQLFGIDGTLPVYNDVRETFPVLAGQIGSFRKDAASVEVETCFYVGSILRYWNLRILPLLNRKEKQTGWLIILNDITERKNAQDALKESERFHRIILETSPNPIAFCDASGCVTYLNPAFTGLFGWHPNELVGKRLDPILNENHSEAGAFLQKQRDASDAVSEYIARMRTRNGNALDISVHFACLRAKDGSVESLVYNFTDITRLKTVENDLTQTRNYIRSIVNSMPSMLIGLDENGRITQWNTEAERWTGVSADQAVGRQLREMLPQISGQIPDVRQIIEQQQAGKESRITLTVQEKTFPAAVTIYPILSDGVKGAVIRVDDIGERVRIEEMMVQSAKMLSMGGLAAGMAHEINNPLAGILQNVQVIRNRLEKDLPANLQAAEECGIKMESMKAYMEKRNIFVMMDLVSASGRRAARIVGSMLAFSHKSPVRKSTHYLHDIMEATLELIRHDYSMKKKYDFRQVDIHRDYRDPVAPVSCEKIQIQQVLLNILKNGAEAMSMAGTPSPAFKIRCFQQDTHVVMEIEDNGPGMDCDIRERIFEPFFTTKAMGVGTGLGLSVSYFIITENHKGELAVDSSPGKGSVFIIKLPVEPSRNH